MKDLNDKIQEAIHNITMHHEQIIDDWCKAYLSELYEEGKDFTKPGMVILNVQNIHEGMSHIKRYWFTKKEEIKDPFKEEIEWIWRSLAESRPLDRTWIYLQRIDTDEIQIVRFPETGISICVPWSEYVWFPVFMPPLYNVSEKEEPEEKVESKITYELMQWINLKDRMPDDNKKVMVRVLSNQFSSPLSKGYPWVFVGSFNRHTGWKVWGVEGYKEITHWMPLLPCAEHSCLFPDNFRDSDKYICDWCEEEYKKIP